MYESSKFNMIIIKHVDRKEFMICFTLIRLNTLPSFPFDDFNAWIGTLLSGFFSERNWMYCYIDIYIYDEWSLGSVTYTYKYIICTQD